jgi:formylglycine-generating enzyme required for sulfatase activity
VARFEITRGQYKAFVTAAGYPVSGGCITDRVVKGKWEPHPTTTLRDPGYAQTDRHPVVCVSWDDAQAYAAWLSKATGKAYRLPTEAEWEYLARAGTITAYPWGPDANAGCADMNGTDRTARAKYPELDAPPDNTYATCSDRALNTAPVGSYRANAFGLHDMIGNVGEWTADCVTPSYAEIGADGRPRTPDCARRMVRGGGWGTFVRQLRSAERIRYAPTDRDDTIGIRVVRDLR